MINHIEISVNTSSLYSEFIGQILLNLSCKGIVLSEFLYSDGRVLSNNVEVKGYFPNIESNKDIINLINSELLNQRKLLLDDGVSEKELGEWSVTHRVVNDEDWSESWKKFWKPQRVGKHIIISPSWEKFEKQSEEDIIINIDPGAAFGTGTHQTTRLCVSALEEILESDRNVNNLLDVGTGTGILAIIAAKLGINKIVGLDIDPIAVEISNENAKINNVENHCEFSDKLLSEINDSYDLVVVNILARTIVSMSDELKRLVKQNGKIILSGFIDTQLDKITDCFKVKGFNLVCIKEEEGWYSVVFEKK